MGRKTTPSVTSGGIGITEEVANIGGMTVTGGVSVELSPVRLDISGNPNYEDPTKSTISIATGAEIPGGILGISGGATINTSTGEVTEISIGGEVAGVGAEISVSKDGSVGVGISLQIPFTPIEISLGLGFPSEKEPTQTPAPTPSMPGVAFSLDQIVPLLQNDKCYHLVILWHTASYNIFTWNPPANAFKFVRASLPSEVHGGGVWTNDTSLFYATNQVIAYERTPAFIDYHEPPDPAGSRDLSSANYNKFSANFKAWGVLNGGYQLILSNRSYKYFDTLLFPFKLVGTGAYLKQYISDYRPTNQIWDISAYEIACSGKSSVDLPKRVSPPTAPSSVPFPNPPPRKENMDDCCRDSLRMLRRIHKHLGVSPIQGMESLEQFAGVKSKGEDFQGDKMAFPFEVPKVWLNPTAKRNETLPVRNLSELLFILGSQSERLENVLGTKEFLKDSQGQLRQSEVSTLRWLTQRMTGISGNDFTYPDPNDFWFNSDDGIINEKKVEVRSVADAIRYLVESQNRLERILPVAEIKNSTIPARWVYPGKKGQLRVGNLIHLVEYMFRADDRARGFWPQTVKIKDANPAIEGDQPIELKFESQADMLREILKFLIDTEGDGDLTNNFALRSAIQQCQIHQSVTQINAMVDAIVEYMDFKIKRTTTKVPMPFSPFAGHEPSLFDNFLSKIGFGNKQIPGSIDKNTEEAVEALFEGVLQNTQVEVAIIEADEKKSLSEALLELLKHTSAASAAVSERVGENALKRLVDSAGIAQAISRYLFKKDIAESNGIGDLDKWINSAESGYTDKPETESLRFPESSSLEPYGRPIAENPLIREIDTKDPKAD
jgi:hypothetical protein